MGASELEIVKSFSDERGAIHASDLGALLEALGAEGDMAVMKARVALLGEQADQDGYRHGHVPEDAFIQWWAHHRDSHIASSPVRGGQRGSPQPPRAASRPKTRQARRPREARPPRKAARAQKSFTRRSSAAGPSRAVERLTRPVSVTGRRPRTAMARPATRASSGRTRSKSRGRARAGRKAWSGADSVASGSTAGDGAARSAMLDAKMTRERAEADMKLLENRLKHLQTQMQKANKRIGQTRQRVADIDKMRAESRQERTTMRRKQHRRRKAVDDRRQANLQARSQAQREREAKRKKLIQDKQAAAQAARRERAKYRNQVEGHRAKLAADNARAKEQVLEQQRRAAAARAAEQQARAAARRKEYDDRIERERQRKQAADEKIQKYEALERELIARLRDSQAQQVAAFEELEAALTSQERREQLRQQQEAQQSQQLSFVAEGEADDAAALS